MSNWVTLSDGRRILLGSDSSGSNSHADAFGSISDFLNTNAKCPVCKKAVVYYQNYSGSKVYFDSAGWPWPKHECTDKAKIDSPCVTHTKIFSNIIYLPDGGRLEALQKNHLKICKRNNEIHDFFLIRLKTKNNRNLFVECGTPWIQD